MQVVELVSVTDWDVTESSGVWVARIGGRYIRVMSATAPWEMAVDATLEFIDKLRERTFPRHVTDPAEIMRFCVKRTRRQR